MSKPVENVQKVRTVVVDDEALGRERLVGLLRKEPQIEIVAECGDGRSALETILREKPDLLFLDVQMPELDGFQVLAEVPEENRPTVVFVTAHDKFALRAFDVHAIDYLLKPFDRERFQTALRRALEKVARSSGGKGDAGVSNLLKEGAAAKPVERLMVKTEGKVRLVKVEEIDFIEAADNYVSLRIGTESLLMRETMNSLEVKLPSEKFMRISRSTIVNLERIKELQPMFHGEYVVILKNGTKLTLSRGYRDKLDALMGRG